MSSSVELTFAGRRLVTGGKVRYAWNDAAADGTSEGLFSKRLVSYATIGQTFAFESPTEGSVSPSTAKYVGTIDSEDPRLVSWRAEDVAASVLVESRRMASRDRLADPIEDAIAVLHAHSNGLRATAKAIAFSDYCRSRILGG